MQLTGQVVDANGTPVPGIVVYAYHADRTGVYPQDAQSHTPHGTLRAWAMTDEHGRYSFDTIRPGKSVAGSELSHVHIVVIEPTRCVYTIDGVLFADDLPQSAGQPHANNARGGDGKSMPTKDRQGVWQVTRDIELGKNVPGYEKCATNSAATSTGK